MRTGNSYYDIASNDLEYIEASFYLGYYNNLAAGCQQVVEKYLKHIVEHFCTDLEDINVMRTHSLKVLQKLIIIVISDVKLNLDDMVFLTDYFDARYPGVDYSIVTEEEAQRCLRIAQEVRDEINRILKRDGE